MITSEATFNTNHLHNQTYMYLQSDNVTIFSTRKYLGIVNIKVNDKY